MGNPAETNGTGESRSGGSQWGLNPKDPAIVKILGEGQKGTPGRDRTENVMTERPSHARWFCP